MFKYLFHYVLILFIYFASLEGINVLQLRNKLCVQFDLY